MHGSDAGAIHSSNGHAAQLNLSFAQRRNVLDGVEEIALPRTIVKRDGRVVPFDPMRIERTIARCFAALGRLAAHQSLRVFEERYRSCKVRQFAQVVRNTSQAAALEHRKRRVVTDLRSLMQVCLGGE